MHFEYTDFNSAGTIFDGQLGAEWLELVDVLTALAPQLQPSDQAGLGGRPIFDPKATNQILTDAAAARGWHKVPVPQSLKEFGVDWDAGKNMVLAEWQFSNYPFLWNNVIRTEAVFKTRLSLPTVGTVKALVIVTKSGQFPASNSTLYYEQAKAQLNVVTELNVFDTPIRLVGLMVPPGATTFDATWNTYTGRYARVPESSTPRTFQVRWRAAGGQGSVVLS